MSVTDASTIIGYAAVSLIILAVARRLSDKRSVTYISDLRGPPADSFLWGVMPSIKQPNDEVAQWPTRYGKTFSVKTFLSMRKLYTVDPRALGYILSHSNEFWKAWDDRAGITALTGPGLVAVEGDAHRRQRKILNPVFSQAQIREHVPAFIHKAEKLRDIWGAELSKGSGGFVEIDVLGWLGRISLDVIGETGFGYDFNSLEDEEIELAKAFYGLFSTLTSFNVLEMLQLWVPAIGYIPTEHNVAFKKNTAVLRRIGEEIMKKSQQHQEANPSNEVSQEKDLLSVLVRSNIADEDGSVPLSTDEVIAQIATFIAAGHETTSAALTWTLYALVKAPEVQRKLRAELVAFPHDNPTMEDLNGLTYLDCVLRESLRVHAPAELTSREARTDEIIPLSEPVTNIHGKTVSEIHVKKGDTILIHVPAINMNEDLWGADAREFRPERWETPPPVGASGIQSVYSNTMTFLSGTRACIGWRLAVYEMKAFLFVLIRSLEFDIDPELSIVKRLGFAVTRPVVEGRESEGHRLPLKISHQQGQ